MVHTVFKSRSPSVKIVVSKSKSRALDLLHTLICGGESSCRVPRRCKTSSPLDMPGKDVLRHI